MVAYHALQWGDGGFETGRAGVDVFFVISGLIMWRVTWGRETAPGPFLWRRLTRVAPLYWLTTLGVLAVALAWPGFLPEVRPGWGHMILSLAFVPHLDPRGLPFPTLPPGWTLDYEAVLYLIVAGALAGPRRWRGRVVAGSLAAVTTFGFLYPEPFYFLGANPMLLQFAAGWALGMAAEHGRHVPRAAGAAMVLAALGLWTGEAAFHLFSELWRPLLWGVPALLMVAGALTLEIGRAPGKAPSNSGPPGRVRLLSVRAALTLGDASYAVYVLHLPATAVVAHTLGWTRIWLFLPAALAASTAAGLAARAWVERPLLTRLRGWRGAR